MKPTRRGFLGIAGAAGAAAALRPSASRGGARAASPQAAGVLVDTHRCIGCRRCEFACQTSHGLSPPPLSSFEDKSVFERTRRPTRRAFTVVNRLQPADGGRELHAKLNCLNCVDPACASACLVKALQKTPEGPVTYDQDRCMGCRYCMVACPFEMPAYDYDDPLHPQVRKCNLCAHLVPAQQPVPACVRICPVEALTFGPRETLLALAHERTRAHPELYSPHVYGEHEAGGTSWLYLARAPLHSAGLPKLPDRAPNELTESVQHGVFKGFAAPAMLYGLLALVARQARSRIPEEPADHGDKP